MEKKSQIDLQRKNIQEFKDSKKIPIVLVLDDLRSALNVGSAFRTADAFQLEKIIICGISAQPPHREILKTALGAELTVDWSYFQNTIDAIEYLKSNGQLIASVEQVKGSLSLEKTNWNFEPLALVFGNEVNGVKEEVINASDFCIEIPQMGTKHSLNVSVSIGICTWNFVSKMLT